MPWVSCRYYERISRRESTTKWSRKVAVDRWWPMTRLRLSRYSRESPPRPARRANNDENTTLQPLTRAAAADAVKFPFFVLVHSIALSAGAQVPP